MMHKIIGNDVITTPFLRFITDSGIAFDPVFTAATATFEWISPDGSISTGTTPNPTLDQTGVYTVKCSDWSNVTRMDFSNDNIITFDNLSLFTSLDRLDCLNNNISILDIAALVLLTTLNCRNNIITTLNIVTLTVLTYLNCKSNDMDETNVDNILTGLVIAGANNGTLDISGTNAAPSAAGDANVLILEGRGWGVTTS